mgnify:CR=1 FL=1
MRTDRPSAEHKQILAGGQGKVAEAAEHFQVLTGFYKETTARLFGAVTMKSDQSPLPDPAELYDNVYERPAAPAEGE